MEVIEKKRLELEGYVAILYEDETKKGPLNNISACTYDGEMLWNIKDVLKPVLGNVTDEWYPEMGIVDGNLSVLAFRGIRYILDGKTGALVKTLIVK